MEMVMAQKSKKHYLTERVDLMTQVVDENLAVVEDYLETQGIKVRKNKFRTGVAKKTGRVTYKEIEKEV